MRDALTPWLEPITLSGNHATLEPLKHEHCDALSEAVADGQLWRLWFTSIPSPEGMLAEIDRRLKLQERGSMLPFAVLNGKGVAIGMTTFMNIEVTNRRLEIGSTWYAKRFQRTAINTQSKLLLMTYAFETLGFIAVEYRTSSLNHRSRRAIERIGAKLDGVLRSHQFHSNGTVRDTCVYSIVKPEWPAVKSHLSFCLECSSDVENQT